MTTSSVHSPRKIVDAGSFVNPIEVSYYALSPVYVQVFVESDGIVTMLTQGSHYTLADIGDPDGFSVTIVNPTSWNADRWAVLVNPPVEQAADLSLGGVFGTLYEDALDAMSRQMQSMNEKIDRTLLLTNTDPGPRLRYSRLTRSQYEAIVTPDPNTLYIIIGD